MRGLYFTSVQAVAWSPQAQKFRLWMPVLPAFGHEQQHLSHYLAYGSMPTLSNIYSVGTVEPLIYPDIYTCCT